VFPADQLEHFTRTPFNQSQISGKQKQIKGMSDEVMFDNQMRTILKDVLVLLTVIAVTMLINFVC